MSTQLMEYLLAGAKDVRRGGTTGVKMRDSNRNGLKNNRLSLDSNIFSAYPKVESDWDLDKICRRTRENSGDVNNRLSLNLEPRKRLAQSNLPVSSPFHRFSDSASESDSDSCSSYRKRRSYIELSVDEPPVNANPRIKSIMAITPKTYAEAQHLKKLLKAVISEPNTTFEDLKLYRQAMKKIRQSIQEQQKVEVDKVTSSKETDSSKLGSTSYGSSRLGSSVNSRPSYLSSINRDRSTSRDRGGYASGYSSGAGSSSLYSSRYSSTGTQDAPKGVSALTSRFGEPKSPNKSTNSDNTNTTSSFNNSAYTRTRSRDLSNLQTSNREPSTLQPTSTKADATRPTYARTRTTDLPSISYSTNPDPVKASSNSTSDRSGNFSDARSGYGSDYSKSGYGSSYGSKYSWTPSTYRPSYSRENSSIASDTGSNTGWRSRVYGKERESSQARPTTLNLETINKPSDENDNKPAVVLKRPSAFQPKPKAQEKSEDNNEKRPNLPSPNAVKVLPLIIPKEIKNKAPADYTSCSELSEDETEISSKSLLSPTRTRSNNQETQRDMRNRPLRYLNAVPELPTRKTTSPSQGLASAPAIKLSEKLSTGKYEMPKLSPSPSKWLTDKKNSQSDAKLSDAISPPLPRRSSPQGCSNDKQLESNAENKECRKFVLNMNVSLDNQDTLRKRNETEPTVRVDGCAQLTGNDLKIDQNHNTVMENLSSKTQSQKVEEKPPLMPCIEKTSSKCKIVERKGSRGNGDSVKRTSSFKRTRERQNSQNAKTSSSVSSSDSESEPISQRSQRSVRQIETKNSSAEILLSKKGDTISQIKSDGYASNASTSSKLSVPMSPNEVRKSNSRHKHGRSSRNSMKNQISKSSDSSDESNNSGEEGCLFSIAKSMTMRPKPVVKQLSMAPTTVISIYGLGDRTSPDGKEMSRENSATNVPAIEGVNGAAKTANSDETKSNVAYEIFQWPEGSPCMNRKQYLPKNEESTAEIDTDIEPFQWPSGSPVLKRRHSYFRTQWDTETETEMENWSDSSLPKMMNKMTKLPEETEDETGFEWPSSPEMWKKHSITKTNQNFEWPSSPEPKLCSDPKFIGFTTDIDALLNEGELDSFKNMEVKMGFTPSKITNDTGEENETVNSETSHEVDDVEQEVEEISSPKSKARANLSLFIGKLTNIDEILGNVLQPLTAPIAIETNSKTTSTTGDEDDDASIHEIQASEVKVHDAQARRAQIGQQIEDENSQEIVRQQEKRKALKEEIIRAVKERLDDATLQIYRDGDYSNYLDLEGTLAEQADDIDGLTENKKNAIILRTQLSVRVHAIVEKLQTSEGRELRRALFSLKQIFQDDKDLVHAFVHHDGLKCLLKVGSCADHNYQTYILRALGQVMLYVDGMTGISNYREVIEWLYSLVTSKFRLVTKTALKLLLVFVEYSEGNALTLIKAIDKVDRNKGYKPWGTLMRILEGKDCPDAELMIFTMTLINKTLNGIPDQDTYYDQSDFLEEQGLETLIQRHMHNPNSDLDLLQQLTIYEAVLTYEDGDDICRTRTIDPTIRQMPRFSASDRDDTNRRRSRRHCVSPDLKDEMREEVSSDEELGHVTLLHILNGLPVDDLGGIKHSDAGVTPALRRRRERAERQRSFLHDQDILSESRRSSHSSDNTSNVEEENKKNAALSGLDQSTKMLEVLCGKREGDVKDIASRISALLEREHNNNNKKLPVNLDIDTSVKDILKKLSTGTTLTSDEQEKLQRIGDVSGRIQKAKEGLAKSQIKPDEPIAIPEVPKQSENDIQWENLKSQLNRPLKLADLDFTDLTEEDDVQTQVNQSIEGTPPPPPPPMMNGIPGPPCNGYIPPPPPPMGSNRSTPIPPPPPVVNGLDIPAPSPIQCSNGIPLAPPIGHNFGVNLQSNSHEDKSQKTKKTIKLFWKEIREDSYRKKHTIWDSLDPINIDTQKLEHLFESRAKDINAKKAQEQKGVKEIIVLDPKRSNMINIGMTKLPPPRTIKTAILKMDSSIINREGIEKLLLTMLPTNEEKQKIQEAAAVNPELPLGSAEQFLMMLSSISELPARLKLWLFKLDYENLEKEVADPLMDIKDGMASLKKNRTFKTIMSILLSVGNFLNGSEAKGFHIEYLSKVPEVKDTVNKHSLLHHLCHFVHEKHPDTTDLYSEIGSITRASKVDFEELQNTIEKLEVDCKSSWDHLKAIAKHDGPTQMKLKMSEFLADCAERIIVLGIIYRRIMKRFRDFLSWMGLTPTAILEAKVQRICSVISEFALEYRTCRERVLQQIQKKANHRERNKTRGKMITEMEKFKGRPKTKEEEADNDLRQLLNYSDVSDTETIRGKNNWRRTRESKTKSREEILLTEGLDDALLDSLVKTATQAPTSRSTPRERKRSRHADRKSLRRTLKNGLTEDEKRFLSMMAAQTR